MQSTCWQPCQTAVAATPAGSALAAYWLLAVTFSACLRSWWIQYYSNPKCAMPGHRAYEGAIFRHGLRGAAVLVGSLTRKARTKPRFLL
jgi:hypothetical protein